jgi:exodeoxyribonuclease V alpha subunit
VAWLEGRLQRVLWLSDRTGYAVVRLGTASGDAMAVGPLAGLAGQAEGSFVALEGEWEDHTVHGRQFRSTAWLDGSPRTLEGLRIWLASAGIKGVGDALAARIVDKFGLELPGVLHDSPQRLLEVNGIGHARAQTIRQAWNRDEEGRALTMLLRGLGLTQRMTERIRERYGDQTMHVVTQQPFQLAEEISGIGFRTADQLARTQGLPPDDPARVRAAVLHVLDQESEQGHCFLTFSQLQQAVAALTVPTDGLADAVASAEGAGRVVVEAGTAGDRVYGANLYHAEVQIARELGMLADRSRQADMPETADVSAAERWVQVELDPSQRAAVASALRPGVTVITGGPGTGKTTLLRILLRVFLERGAIVKLASPTGRAARRLEEATRAPASTLHRLLEFDPSTNRFARTMGQPLEADVVVVDEASMVDVPLMAALLEALPIDKPDMSLVLVGDVDQLPSVGPGQVLRDVIESGVVPVARLSTLHRQSEGSGLIQAARDLREGRVPVSGERAGVADVFLLPRADAEEAVQTLLKVVSERLPAMGFDPRSEVQVLAPTRRGALGTERLNTELQARLNPETQAILRGERSFRKNDRVICTKNRYDVEVFNGDIGRILEVSEGGLSIDFDGRVVPWERMDLGMLDLAYAITVHKSQGSEYPAVVLALHGSHGLMLRRNLFYTAATRPKRFLCVVGNPEAWGRAVRNVGGDDRNTLLAERLKESAS